MNKIGIITLMGNENYGNKLQNYALQTVLISKNFEVETLRNNEIDLKKNTLLKKIQRINLIKILNKIKKFFESHEIKDIKNNRFNIFVEFTKKHINMSQYDIKEDISLIKEEYKYFVIGSDQVWHPQVSTPFTTNFAMFSNNKNKFSYAASFGVNNIPLEYQKIYKKGLEDLKYISVREERGKEIVEKLTNRTDVEVLVDPTMLLTEDEWNKISKKPKQIKTLNGEKYILNYFLGDLSDTRKKEIERVAKENDCKIINILNPNDPFYVSGPSEFLWLEKNAFLICTDSFHSSVFAFLFDRPFIIFDREQKHIENMSSRLDTLMKKFQLKNRRFEGKITQSNIEHDYSEGYKILVEERKKSEKFLKKALDIEEN